MLQLSDEEMKELTTECEHYEQNTTRLTNADIRKIARYIVTNFIDDIRGPPGKEGEPHQDSVIKANMLALSTGMSRLNQEIRLLEQQLQTAQEDIASLRLTVNTLRCQMDIKDVTNSVK